MSRCHSSNGLGVALRQCRIINFTYAIEEEEGKNDSDNKKNKEKGGTPNVYPVSS